MYKSREFNQKDLETFEIEIGEGEYRILQLTDFHLGYGRLSVRQDEKAENAIAKIIGDASPDLIVITGDMIFPFLPKSGTLDNRKQGERFLKFMDSFKIPYAMVMGNHDTEIGSSLNREELGKLLKKGEYSIFTEGRDDIYGVGNYFINLKRQGKTERILAMLDSNMYKGKLFYGGFDVIHDDQIKWCMEGLSKARNENSNVKAFAFFHMPLKEYKEAYEKMKLGNPSVKYCFGSVLEQNEYFGISCLDGAFFNEALENGVIDGIFCGHDHLNTISMEYKGIRLTYGLSIDFLGYSGIEKLYTQRGGTLITLNKKETDIRPVPLGPVVSTRVRGLKK